MALLVIADDDEDLLAFFAHAFIRAGHSVIECRDGDTALAQVRKQHPDLVLTDVEMPPGISGLDVTAAIRADPQMAGIPIIVATGG